MFILKNCFQVKMCSVKHNPHSALQNIDAQCRSRDANKYSCERAWSGRKGSIEMTSLRIEMCKHMGGDTIEM